MSTPSSDEPGTAPDPITESSVTEAFKQLPANQSKPGVDEPASEPASEPMAPDDSAIPDDEDMPDVNDGEAPKPMAGDDDLISGQYGPTADFGEG